MKSFPRRQLGKRSVRPSVIGLGTGALGGFGVAVGYPLFEQTILAADSASVFWEQLRRGGYRALDGLRSAGATGAIGLGINETDSVLEAAEFSLDCALIAG